MAPPKDFCPLSGEEQTETQHHNQQEGGNGLAAAAGLAESSPWN